MSETPRQFSDLSADTQDLLVIYRNLRHELVLLTAAGPLMERREKFSKLQDGERRGHEETTTVREQFRLLFKLREILIAEGVPLDIKMQPIKTESAPKPEPVRKAAAANATATAAAAPSPHAEEKLTRPHPEAAAAVTYVTPSQHGFFQHLQHAAKRALRLRVEPHAQCLTERPRAGSCPNRQRFPVSDWSVSV